MTITLYMPRYHPHFDRMVEVCHWCEAQFGRSDYLTNWAVDFADDTEDWVEFTFYDATYAWWAQARHPDLITWEQWDDLGVDFQGRRIVE